MSLAVHASAHWLRLARFRLRLDRLRILAWALAGLLLTALVASTWDALYPTAQGRLDFAATLQGAPALTALLGPLQAPESTGGLTTWRIGGLSLMMIGIVVVFLVVRHTRADVSSGRAELLLSGAVRRRSLVSAGIVPAAAVAVGFGVMSAAALGFGGRGWMGALVYGASICGSLLLFAALASVIAQAFSSSRAANGAGILALAMLFLLNSIGNTRSSTLLTELSPFGWASHASPYAQDLWAWALLPWLAAALVVALSIALADRHDLGSAWTREREGREHGAMWLRRPWALIWRVDRAVITGWIVGFLLLSLVVGYLAGSLAELISENPQIAEFIDRLGRESSTESLTAVILVFTALAAAGFPISLLLRHASDESEGRAELLLSTRLHRSQLLITRVVEAWLGVLVLQLVLGLGVGLVSGLFAEDAGASLRDAIGISLVSLPAIWFIAGLTTLLVACSPQLGWIGWLALAWCVVFGELAPLMNLPGWMERLTPYWYNPDWPLSGDGGPALLMTALAVAMSAVAVIVYRRRRIPS